MRHLAQVHRDPQTEQVTLRLLAVQKAEYAWAILPTPVEIEVPPSTDYCTDNHRLLMVDLSSSQSVMAIEDALPWLLSVLDDYLSKGLSPSTLQEEVDRAEQWRQSLTLRSQELGRRALEMEARRDQIHELEKNLLEDKEKLEAIAAQLKLNQDGEAADASSPLETSG